MEERWKAGQSGYQIKCVSIACTAEICIGVLNRPTEKQLLEAIALRIQRLKPANIPKPPYTTATPSPTPAPKPAAKTAKSKSKAPIPKPPKNQGGRRLPVPPMPHPPLASRVSPYSPALASGMFVEAVKAAMSTTEGGAGGAGAGAAGAGAGMGKGKRKVVRVRG